MRPEKDPLCSKVGFYLRENVNNGPIFSNQAAVKTLLCRIGSSGRLLIGRLLPLKEAARWEPLTLWWSPRIDQSNLCSALGTLQTDLFQTTDQFSSQASLLKATITQLRRLKILQLQTTSQPAGSSQTGSSQGEGSDAAKGSVQKAGSNASTSVSALKSKYELNPLFRDTLICILSRHFKDYQNLALSKSSDFSDSQAAPSGSASNVISIPAATIESGDTTSNPGENGWGYVDDVISVGPIESPNYLALENKSKKQWGNLLRWLFRESVKINSFPIQLNNSTPPVPILYNILQFRNLIPGAASGAQHAATSHGGGFLGASATGTASNHMNNQKQTRPKISKATLYWLLSDLSEQVCIILFTYIDALKEGFINQFGELTPQIPGPYANLQPSSLSAVSSSGLNASAAPPGNAPANECNVFKAGKLLAFLCELSQAKIGQSLVLKANVNDDIVFMRFLELLEAIGLVITLRTKLQTLKQESTVRTMVFPTPLSRVLTLDTADATHGDAWALAHAFSSSDSLDTVDRADCIELLLPAQRYAAASLATTPKPVSPEDFEFDWDKPSDILSELVVTHDIAPGSAQAALKRSKKPTKEEGLVVESNFRVFAYRPGPLQAAVIFNLCDVKIMAPTMIVGVLTRDSVMAAFADGLTAKHIIRFFASHSHPSIRRRISTHPGGGIGAMGGSDWTGPLPVALPENVANQIILWEQQRQSLIIEPACVFEITEEVELNIFPLLLARARLSGSLLCHTPLPKSRGFSGAGGPLSGANSNIRSPEFQEWKKQTMERIKSQQQNPALQGYNSDGWYTQGAIIVVKQEAKDEFIRHFKQIRAGANFSSSKNK